MILLKDILVQIFLLFFLSSSFINGDERLRKVYDQLGCSPIPGNSSKPEAYNCDNIFSIQKGVCYYNGHEYQERDYLSDEDEKVNPCLSSCKCQLVDRYSIKNNATYINCRKKVCSVGSVFEEPTKKGCYLQYSKDACCDVRTYCPDENVSVHQCVHDGKTYKEGEQIYINDYTCICSSQFKGVVDDQNCRKRRCDFDGSIFYAYILDKSAAVFTDVSKVLTVSECPMGWYNPKYNKEKIIKMESSELSISPHKCEYGNLTLSIGQKLEIEDNSTFKNFKKNCSCSIPPFVSCNAYK